MASSSSSAFVDVAIVGVGLVGSSVIKQLLTVPSLNPILRIVLLQNSKKALIKPNGLPTSAASTWANDLTSSQDAALAPADLVSHLQSHRSQAAKHVVVVDNTSSQVIADAYPSFLNAGFSVVTPNKKAFSASSSLYASILSAIKSKSSSSTPAIERPLIYQESTVGAGLPIIGTLNDLVGTGDQVRKIEGVFSGTFSYIFNNYSTVKGSQVGFSQVVRVAKENGYTEPHPGDDLSGSDVARKLAILARLLPDQFDPKSSLPEGYASVDTKSLTPEPLQDVTDPTEYVNRLPDFDADFDKLRKQAFEQGQVLRYVGVIDVEKKVIKASLESYPFSHPFASALSGSDNIVAFHTERYANAPLIVQGAGAGADVTAMGVVADLRRVSERRAV
ncbi:Homoserine dehydrogenase [Tilletia horrida]|uniref:Homoserine dehydrogenase n=1 Tax=Tilletia horrida TaxID=155126 RepID=A0AAN6JV98_9BASI|nr:Homoserine dehydrogenase [Tilletia horrida]KAK0550563.1 Homoserine dehydrogenase [Tilletia horrida]KAK0560283.1 Homoserine dehydrogenase [Tilletia horrida]